MNRRKFLQLGVLGTGAVLTGAESLRGDSATNALIVARAAKASTMVAMPISIAALVQRDLDAMFADMRDRAGVNALFPFMYSA